MRVAIVNQHPQDVLGGSEIQCDLIARGLVLRGHHVVYVAVAGCGEYRVPYEVRTAPFRGSAIAQACVDAEPEVVYWRLNLRSFRAAAAGLRRAGVPLVFAVSNRNDVNPWRSPTMVAGGLQDRLLRLAFQLYHRWNYTGWRHVEGAVTLNGDLLDRIPATRRAHIPNAMPRNTVSFSWERPYAVWVANLKPHKRPEACLEISDLLAGLGVDLLMVGHNRHIRYQTFGSARALPASLHYLGPRKLEEVNGMLANSRFLVHTGYPEGFGNVFIQAWLQGRPVVSFEFDPEGLITREGLGLCAQGDMQLFRRQIQWLVEHPEEAQRLGGRAREFASSQFDLDRNLNLLEAFLWEVVTAEHDSTSGAASLKHPLSWVCHTRAHPRHRS